MIEKLAKGIATVLFVVVFILILGVLGVLGLGIVKLLMMLAAA